MHASIIWWNTSLAPVTAQHRATAEDKSVVVSIVKSLTEDLSIDIICLGEMSPAAIELLRTECDLGDYSVYEGVSRVGQRSAFDVCVLYKTKRIFILDEEAIVQFSGGSQLKVGQRLDMVLADKETILHLFVSHWPSRRNCEEENPTRRKLGRTLRDAVEAAIGADHTGHAIVLGDFNDEPFSPSLRHELQAVRDRDLAASKRYFLYNPFWKQMSPRLSGPDLLGNEPWLGGSCYYYGTGALTHWHSFDQIIFSSSLLGGSAWQLLDNTVSVMNIPGYTELVLDKRRKFDHLPVLAVIERTDSHG